MCTPLAAFYHIANIKGYDFIGTSSSGVNAYFVRKDLSTPFQIKSLEEGFHESYNRDSKDKNGHLTFLDHHERLKEIKKLSLVDVVSGKENSIEKWFNLP